MGIKEAEEEPNAKGEKCEIVNLWEVLGRKWALLILKNLHTKEAIRFNELKRIMPGISSTVLADRLLSSNVKALFLRGSTQKPPKVEYRLTIRARELGVILKELWRLTQRWKAPRLPPTTVTSAK